MKRTALKKPQFKKCPECKLKKPIFKGVVCSVECAVEYTKKQNQKNWNKRKSEMKDGLKTHNDYSKELEVLVNKFIRLRDEDKPCISCNSPAGTFKLTAGHYYPAGTYKNIRFNEDNIHGQCWYNCNKNKHGNLSEYRPRLIERIGIERVEELDRLRNVDAKFSIPELIKMKTLYRKKIKQILKSK